MTYDEFFAEAARLKVRVLPEHPNDVRAMLDAKDAEIERLRWLLREASDTLAMWADVAPAVSLRADIAKALALPDPASPPEKRND